MRRFFRIILDATRHWFDDQAFKHSAAVSFSVLFSLAPVSLIALAIGGFFLGQAEAERQFTAQLTQLVGPKSTELIRGVATATAASGGGWLAGVGGTLLLVIGATSAFGQLQDSLNDIWQVRIRPDARGWKIWLTRRLVSFGLVVTVGFLLLVSLILTTGLSALTAHFGPEGTTVLAHAADFLVGLVVIAGLFALIFKVLPDVQLRWRDVLPGALLTAGLFSIGRILIALYLARSTVTSIYGTAGSLVALQIWVYYSCAILFFGVELTVASRRGRHVVVTPKPAAITYREQLVPLASSRRAAK